MELLEPVGLALHPPFASRCLLQLCLLDLSQFDQDVLLGGCKCLVIRLEGAPRLIGQLFSQLEVGLHVGVGRGQPQVHLHDHLPAVSGHVSRGFQVGIDIFQQERDGIPLEVQAVDDRGHRVVALLLLLDHLFQISPAESGGKGLPHRIHGRIGLTQAAL